MYEYLRFDKKSDAKAKKAELQAAGFDPMIYKGHRHYVVQWFVNTSAA